MIRRPPRPPIKMMQPIALDLANSVTLLQRYKELSGFGFSRIALYLFPDSHSTDSDNESAEENFECTNNVGGQGKCFVRESNRKITYIKQLLNEVE